MKKSKIFILKMIIIVFAGATIIVLANPTQYQSQSIPKYVGVNTCVGACHKSEAQGKQLDIWKDSKHAKAFETLQTPEADKIANDKGFTTAAAETKECVKCHVLGKDLEECEFESTFDKTQGVQCESCHGPGSEYKKISIMKDREKSKAAGLIIHTKREAFCTGCHNSESPTFVEFNYEEAWAKIKHGKPAKE